MPAASTRDLTRFVTASTVLAVGLSAGLSTTPSTAVAAGSTAADPVACSTPLLERATRGSEVRAASRSDLAAAAEVNGLSVRELAAEVAADRTVWLDTCGRSFHVEAAHPMAAVSSPADEASTLASSDLEAPASTFALESNPGADLTIYLDFTGGEVSDTAWNDTYDASSITVLPYSITSPADTTFTAAELREVQQAWQVVAEDFASFDVNVTTKPPAPGAIERSSPTDTTYGTRVLITGGGPIYEACGCGGVAYVDVFDRADAHEYYQPAWVFTFGTTTSGKRLGEAASHEAGHNLGLGHDGTVGASYYPGAAPWAPIMGQSYDQPVTQWSRGDYPGGTNTEDDVAVIAAQLGVRDDDHADTAAGATELADTPLDGVITTRTDADAFTFSAAGSTTLTAAPGPGFPDLDIGVRILDSSGALVAAVDPAAVRVGPSTASGLGATWTATLTREPATYTVVVDGVGTGDPATSGRYSDYASLGRYDLSLVTDTPGGANLVAVSTSPAPARVGVAFRAVAAHATGGEAPYAWSATGLPAGLTLDAGTAVLTGTPTAAGSFGVTAQVRDHAGGSASTAFVVTVDPGSPTVVTTVPDVVVTPAPTTPPAGSAVPLPVAVLGFVTGAHLPKGQVRHGYRAMIVIRGASGAVSWRQSGRVPPGLRLVHRTSGGLAVRGRPTQAGRYVVTLVATDTSGARSSRRFALRISR